MERRAGLLLATETALAGLTAAAVLSMHTLFVDGSFRAPLLVQVLAAHLTVGALRRWNVGLAAAALLTTAVGTLTITWTQYARTMWGILPSSLTLPEVRADIDAAWQVFADVSAPAPVEPGFVVVASVAVWAIVFVADWGAFRTGVSFEAVLPSGTLFVFAAVLGEERNTAIAATFFAAAALAFFLLHRTWRQEASAPGPRQQQHRTRRVLLSAGAALAGFAVVAAGVIAPQLPGAADPAVIPWRDINDDDDSRVVVSPLVDVRSRLVDQPNVEVFTVRADAPETGMPTGSHWRLTALDTFDGTIWRSSYQTDEADGDLPRAVDSAADARSVRQTITVQALAAIWLPAAYEPVAIDAAGTGINYDARSSTIIVDRSTDTSDGLMYAVQSAIPQWTADQLRQAPDEVPDEIAERYLQLPDNFSDRIGQEAMRLTADAPTTYDRAIAMMRYLRGFEYTQDPQGGHSVDALERFLFENQRGYCEQFAGAFAAMARSINIPARVAVGFTKGIQDPNEPTLFRVTGKHAHAWVEVYFEGYGWVTFDPTPGRAPPGAEAWLGVPEAQAADDSDGTVSTTVPGGSSAPPGSPGPPASTPASDAAPQDDASDAVAGAPDEVPTGSDDSGGLLSGTLRTIAVRMGLGALAYALVVPLAIVVQRRVRRRRAQAPVDVIRQAWDEATEHAAAMRIELPPSMTMTERANRIRTALPEAASAIDDLARFSEQALYAPTPPLPAEAARLRTAADVLGAEVARHQPWYRRVLGYLDARRLLPRRRVTRHIAHGAARSLQPT
jgi:transglutaminase-like putative cysteine protease